MRGFTLLEVLVALVIMVGGIIIVANSWSGNLLKLRKATLYNNVGVLLERKVTELEVLYKQKTLDEIPEEDGGDIEGYPQYKWKLRSRKFEMPDMSSMFIKDKGGADELFLSMMKQVNEFIGKSVKEVKISIVITNTKKPLEYWVTTYFVDYTVDLSLPGIPGGGAKTTGGTPTQPGGAPAAAPQGVGP
jgi:general secretion pathway protein I